MNRYMVFYGQKYYPDGGMEDFIGDYSELDGAISVLHEKNRETRQNWEFSWGHVYDLIEKNIVYTNPPY